MRTGMGAMPRPANPGISHICWDTLGSARLGVFANAVRRSVLWHAPAGLGDVALPPPGVTDQDADRGRLGAAGHLEAVQVGRQIASLL